MTQYTKGQRIQYKARDQLINEGFHIVVSARSLGPFDLIGYNKYSVRWIQVKSCSQKKFYPNPIELSEFEEEEIPCGYDKEMWIWFKKKREWRKWIYRLINTWQWALAEGQETLSKKDLEKFIDQPLLTAKKPF